MSQTLEVLVQFVSILAIIIACVRFFIKIANRSIFEIILVSNNTRMWEDFVEILFAVLFLMLLQTIPVIFTDFRISNVVLGIITFIDLVTFSISFIVLFIYGIFRFFSNWIKRFSRVVNIALSINMISVFASCSLITFSFKSEILQKVEKNEFSDLVLSYLLIYISYLLVLFLYRNVYLYFNGRKQVAYKVEISDINILDSLYFIFALDNDRHVLTNYPVNRKKLSLPAYLYYPREKILYKYTKE